VLCYPNYIYFFYLALPGKSGDPSLSSASMSGMPGIVSGSGETVGLWGVAMWQFSLCSEMHKGARSWVEGAGGVVSTSIAVLDSAAASF
jgi:hypothetical protein